MKSTLTFIAIGLVSFLCLSSSENEDKYEPNFAYFDSNVSNTKDLLNQHNNKYEKAQNYLLDTIHSFRNINSVTPCKFSVRYVPTYIDRKILVSNTVYKKIVYTIFTSRGAHIRKDTIDASTYDVINYNNKKNQ